MDLSSEMNKHGRNPISHKLEDQKKIYTDWANHYLAKSGHKRLIKDLQQDIADGVLLAEIIQIIANEKVEDINGCPRSHSQMIENVDVCLSFLAARGVNVQGLSAEEIRNGNLKAILGLFFSLSRYKQQQHHQQQYYQSLVELQQQVPSTSPEISQSKTHQDMQSSLTTRYATQSNHSGIATSQKKASRLPGPSRVPAAGSSTKVQGASNLNRRSQSFNSIDKNKPPQYANGNEKADSPKGPHPSAGMNGNVQHPTSTGQQQVSAIPSPSASKPWRSKSMNVKHSATSTMLSVKQPSPATSPTPTSDRLKPPPSEGVKPPSSGQKSMLEKFKLVNARTALRPPLSLSSGPSDSGREDDTFSECGETDVLSGGVNSGGSTSSSPKVSPKLTPPKAGSKNLSNKKSLLQPKDKEEKNRDKNKVCTEKAVKEEKDQVIETSTKKSSKIASLIPKGSKATAAKKESLILSSSGIPKPGSKVPTAKQSTSSTCTGSKEVEKLRTTKGNQSQSTAKSQLSEKASPSSGLASSEGKEPSAGSSAALSASMAASSGQGTGNGVVQLPQQQQYSHPNTATVAPFIYRTLSENDSTSLPTADSCTSPTKMDLSFSKTAKQCLEEISGEDPEARRMRTVKNIADLRQNLEETMSSLRGTQISHSTLETTFDSTVTTEVNGRSIPSLSNRSAPVTWRLGQASPRLQAGDAPSLGAGYPRSSASRFIHTDPSRFMYTTPLRRAAVSRLGNISQIDMSEKGSGDLDISSEADVGGYMSDGDILGKSLRTDDINSGYMTDGGLNLYTRSLNRIPDLAASRDVIQRGVHDVTVDADSWDDSSSVSSGLSDTLDNLSTDDLNTTSSVSSYSNITASSRKNTHAQLKTDSEKRSVTDSETWGSTEELKKPEEDFDSSVDSSGKWKGLPSGLSEESEKGGQKASVSISQTGSWRRGMTAQVGTAQSRHKAGTSALKTPGKTDDAKASEKVKTPLKGASIQRSPSDAGKSSGDEGKKPPSGIGRSTATGSFGFKKSGLGSSTIITASGATITSGSATLGKMPKSSAISGKSNAGRKTSLDGSQNQDDGILHVSSKTTLQYRSLPRPSKSSGSGIPGRGGHRSSTSSIDSNVSSKSAGAAATKLREPSKIGSGRSSPVTINQTDKEKEKVAVSDSESVSLSSSPKSSPTSASASGTPGLRQPGSKYPDIASPTFRRLFGAKASGKAASAPSTEGVKPTSAMPSPSTTLARQGSLESPSSGTGSMGSAGGQSGSSSPLFSKPSDLNADVVSLSHSLASSPASVHSFTSGGLVWAANLSSSSAGSKDTPSYQSMTSLHTSSESIDLPLSHHGSLSGLTTSTQEVQSLLMRTGSVRSTLSERYTPSSRQTSQEEGKEWLRSHSTGGLQDTGSQSPLVSPSAMSSSATGKYHFSNLVSPTNLSQFNLPGPSMMRSNSIPAQDTSFDLYDDSQLCGSATSLEERPRAISHSGSFRDSMEEVHGSSLSLVSSTSSLYSTAEEKAHSEQIQKLRRELVASQEKVATLTSQLSANAHLVAAFEKSLGNMTGRLQSLTMTAEQKESELIELRETIEMLKAQNSAAQAAIQGALNGPDHTHKDLRIRRQHSSESVSSINSATSHSSIGSGNDVDSKKKKKKNWLRSSFKQAFGKKKSTKPPSSHSDIEELTDSSLPSSPKLPHSSGECGATSMKPSQSASAICECTEAEAEIILQLKSELREKELKLTDIRLEALSSAHHLDQIREAMNRMQNEIEVLKAENDRLKAETGNTGKPTRPSSGSSSSTSSSSSRQSLGLSLNNLNITESVTSDILLDDVTDGTLNKEGHSVKILVTINKGYSRAKDQKPHAYLIGSIGVSGKTKWDVLDGVIRRLFKEYIFRVDPTTSLGLNSDCIASYCIGDVIRAHSLEVPELLPCGYLVGDNNIITVNLKGVEENSLDSFVFDTLIPKPITQRYFNLLMEHRRIILSGPSGTGKTYLANRMAEYVITKSGRKKTEDAIATFNVDHKSSKDLRQYLANLAEQCSADNNGADLPVVIILDNLHHIGSLSDIFNGFLNCKYNKCPYIIGTMNQGVSSSPNLELHHNFRWVLCANHTEPVKGFLGRYLRRKLIETEIEKNIRNNELMKIIDWIPKTWHHLNSFLETHSSSDVTIGPRLFLPCPMDVDGSRVWFTDLWNYSLVPYLLEAVREGLQMYGKRAPWEDPSKWVADTYPWSSASQQHEWPSLLQLRPEDVGYEGYASAKEGTTSKHVPQTDTEGDPLMSMLMRLQEAANYSSAQSCDSDSTSHHDDILDSSLESTL
ncbi:neuron navigator 3 isoform X4 [Myiozetetes cayanensis]|uniref:neuron navigator 3 isoform X4 n=1 Tax=Myiozetetes cayanensis TaxID=478635 RepID=UPI0021605AE1|nr:neuron navigator 3 isoform X4 [Myiozetetes cayanensis]XP_050180383.1 neuron navigator 3 isoform X4 [Myiozetetes cayanensis]XP_050180384.1 neuron navigator 3 isoform X4 [Myiozetetes cayanensis]XP_050180385.1 neuron navigator 3 isoform X4 [Myiozetetes cayanensis]XP_050180386.1 neuron navigator 3 isoform X4 [Myiozetetes cayanensis]